MRDFRMIGIIILGTLVILGSGCGKKTANRSLTILPDVPATESPTAASANANESPGNLLNDQLRPAFFAYDSHILNQDARAALDHNARLLGDHASVAALIEGHCDERGTPEYNLALGERRALAARAYLVDQGIEASRLEIISYGEERPFALGHDERSWAQNRRAGLVAR